MAGHNGQNQRDRGASSALSPRGQRMPTMWEQMDQEFGDMRRRMLEMFRRPFGAAMPFSVVAQQQTWSPSADAYVKDNKLYIRAELPGVKTEDLSVHLDDGVLTIRGERKDEQENRDAQYWFTERFSGSFERRFAVPDTVQAEQIEAEYKDGVLEITVPLPEQTDRQPQKVTIRGAGSGSGQQVAPQSGPAGAQQPAANGSAENNAGATANQPAGGRT